MGRAQDIYGPDVSLVHHRSGSAHAARCAPGILALLSDVHARNGLVLELGCGSGPLTRELIAAGHRVIATDASAAMVALASEHVGRGAEDVRQLKLGVDAVPAADAIVAVGHPLNYLANADEIDAALIAIARALRPGGIVAMDICDLGWGRGDLTPLGRVGDDWAIIVEFTMPAPDRFDRDITTFLPNQDGTWRRSDEHHTSALVDTARIPPMLATHGVEAVVADSFGGELLPAGLCAVIGRRAGAG